MKLARWAGVGAALLLFGACGACGGAFPAASTSGCAHPGICLTLTGPFAGTTDGLTGPVDCIPGGGLDAVFITDVGGRETSIEILITDNSAKSSPGFKAGTFRVATRSEQTPSSAFASVFVTPDTAVAGVPRGWSSDAAGSSGTVVIKGDESGTVQNVVVAPAQGGTGVLHVSGTFNCR